MSKTIQELRDAQAATMAAIAAAPIGTVSGKDMKAALDFCGVGLSTQDPGRQIASREVYLLGPAVPRIVEERKPFNEAQPVVQEEPEIIILGSDEDHDIAVKFISDMVHEAVEDMKNEEANLQDLLGKAVTIHLVEFDWSYGHEIVECHSEEAARAYPAQVRAKYPAFRFTNFKIHKQLRVDIEGVIELET